jgi:2-oxoisovalerate dehydrogenase E2 component (dihydrolipoyl transacylase)
MTATTFHRVRSDHPEDDALGRVFGPGELVPNLDLTSEEHKDFNQRKVDEGIFYPVDESDVSPDEVPALPSEGSSGPDATEAATRMAEENNIDLTQLTGTGKDGRIIDADVEAAIEAAAEGGDGGNSSEGDD